MTTIDADDPFARHEALHVALLMSEIFESHLLQHPSIANDSALKAQAEQISGALHDLYQAIGRRNFAD